MAGADPPPHGRVGRGFFNSIHQQLPPRISERFPFVLESYVSYWLSRLADTRIILLAPDGSLVSLSDGWTECYPPKGFLCKASPSRVPPFDDSTLLRELDEDVNRLDRFQHACFGPGIGSPGPPSCMSSGFHQMAPLVIQAGLMFPGQTMAVENPEVHLHPSMQLRVSEFLMAQARRDGRNLIVETHSDLVIRRLLRAILQEDIPQEDVRVYFTDTELDTEGYHYSSLKPLEVNDMGQIRNWPAGFMDDDVMESRRLIDAMYPEAKDQPDDDDAS